MGCVCCANKGKYHSAGWHRVLPLRDTLLISGFPLKTNEQGVMGNSPREDSQCGAAGFWQRTSRTAGIPGMGRAAPCKGCCFP